MLSEHASPLAVLGSQDAGGQNVYVDEISRQLAARGHSVDVFTRRDDAASAPVVEYAPGVRVIHLDAGPPEFVPKDDLWAYMPELLGAMHSFLVQTSTHYDVVHSHFWMSGWVAMQLRSRCELPVVHHSHALGVTKQRFQGSADTSPPARLSVERDVIREVDRVIAQCPAERDELIGDYGARPEKIALIPGAANLARFRPIPPDEARRRANLNAEDFVVVYVGRMLPRKGIRTLVRAFAMLAERVELHGARIPLKLVLVGGDSPDPDPAVTPEIGVALRMADQLGIRDMVQCTGKRQPDQLAWFYNAADVMVTVPWYEPFGLTPLEAMACGCPVIGSAVGGLPYTIQHGVTGMLVPPRDPRALADAMYDLFVRPETRLAMGQAARRRMEREFSWDTVARRTEALYQQFVHDTRLVSGSIS